MKEVVEYLSGHNIICKTLREIMPKALGSRKKIELFVGVNLQGYYCSVMILKKRSRVLRKEVGELMLLHEKMEYYEDSKILKRYIHIKAPLCSHAKRMFEDSGWTVWHEVSIP